ncbi:GDP-6-deoxy-D-lyxo-4-hexulose reductase [Burkholderia contaminans FFH2055]|uniref:NAD-dependent epimerase/dehydratase family protein n=1 Tax=Burkholderia TaxID=32008 RepID=UPI0006260D67|nr:MULTISPECIES: NAD-dependent epimerase/dehydratase family protein [Burkholderia]AKM40446.1 GDP-6-deoxy-D-lyxo-4-hexulose reductase [Burkholderia contaminans]AOL03167.1 GDP-mannose 4,6 dehydratase [Burkholderia contaminans]ELK6463191.1 NAD-dependent epimerase/dehydratase family protein [Burkholderia contaminans]KKL37966.1 GDP-6-deoxy-D-lyxo-4-hexulose reductase [Burkholderia contaminans FFH2055]MCA7887549.1 NAD-dependent epimerase/dehydratase family protein [Burkholderia contaminans]
MNAASRSDTPRALVTGLGGFTGDYLAKSLQAAGYRVFGTTHGSEASGAGMYRVDLCDRAALAKVVADVQPDVVAHLAAVSFVAHGDADAIYRTNVVGSRNLLEALANLANRPRAILLASSANIYGNAAVEIIDESVEPNPANDYAVSKLAMEYLARLWQDKLPIVVARPFNYTGVGQSPQFLLPKIVSHFQRGERVIELGNIDVERDFSDVRRVVDAYRRLLEQAPAGGVFNVCSGRAVSLKAVIAMMEQIAGYTIDVQVNPAFVRANEVRRLQGNGARLQAAIGTLDDIPLESTLRWMFEAGRG